MKQLAQLPPTNYHILLLFMQLSCVSPNSITVWFQFIIPFSQSYIMPEFVYI